MSQHLVQPGLPEVAFRGEETAATLCLAASSGGHLELLTAIRQATEGWRRIWITPGSRRADALRAEGEDVREAPFYGRSLLGFLRAARLAVREVRNLRPDVVVTSGAGPVVPFCIFSRLLGSKIVFVETMARVTNASLSGRILSRLASVVLVQWPEMGDVYRGARLCQPALLDSVRPRLDDPGSGTFVALGTHVQPFDRLLAMVDEAIDRGVLPQPVVAQVGVSKYQPRNFQALEWMLPDEMERAVERAEVVVSHAGSGAIALALQVGKRPLVVARKRAHGEHVDDHQAQITDRLDTMDLIVELRDAIEKQHLVRASRPLSLETPPVADGVLSAEASLKAALDELAVTSSAGPVDSG